MGDGFSTLPKSARMWQVSVDLSVLFFPHFLERREGEETHDIVRVDVLDYDTLGRQLGLKTLGPRSEERLAGGVDGEHWGRRCACKRTHVQDQALFAELWVRSRTRKRCVSMCRPVT